MAARTRAPRRIYLLKYWLLMRQMYAVMFIRHQQLLAKATFDVGRAQNWYCDVKQRATYSIRIS